MFSAHGLTQRLVGIHRLHWCGNGEVPYPRPIHVLEGPGSCRVAFCIFARHFADISAPILARVREYNGV